MATKDPAPAGEKAVQFGIRCTPEFRDALEAAAKRDGRSASEMARRIIGHSLKAWGMLPQEAE